MSLALNIPAHTRGCTVAREKKRACVLSRFASQRTATAFAGRGSVAWSSAAKRRQTTVTDDGLNKRAPARRAKTSPSAGYDPATAGRLDF